MKKLLVASILSAWAVSAFADTTTTTGTTTEPVIDSNDSLEQQRMKERGSEINDDQSNSDFVPGTPLNDAEEIEDIEESEYEQ